MSWKLVEEEVCRYVHLVHKDLSILTDGLSNFMHELVQLPALVA